MVAELETKKTNNEEVIGYLPGINTPEISTSSISTSEGAKA
jgi:hypothetical protein